MKEFIGIETNNKGIVLESDLGYICNYKCSYCPPWLHNGSDWINFNDLKNLINHIKPTLVILPGGEPTYYPDFISLLKFIKNDIGSKTCVVSNASRSLEWWEEYHNLMDLLVFSLQIEFVNVEEFISKVKMVSKNRILTINLQMIPERFDELISIANTIISNSQNVVILLKALVNSETGDKFNYSKEQYDIMSNYMRSKTFTTTNPIRNTIHKKYSDGSLELVVPQKLISDKENIYTGWYCWKGQQTLKVLADGDIYNATCEVTQPLIKPIGNISKFDEIKFPNKPIICTKNICNCATSLKSIHKEKYYEEL